MLVYQFEFEASVYYSKVFTHKTVSQLNKVWLLFGYTQVAAVGLHVYSIV